MKLLPLILLCGSMAGQVMTSDVACSNGRPTVILWRDDGGYLRVTKCQGGKASLLEDVLPCGALQKELPLSEMPYRMDFKTPEPMDVPAIQETRYQIICEKPLGCGMKDGTKRKYSAWTCSKGSHRILMQDVDGDWHCLKFPQAEKK